MSHISDGTLLWGEVVYTGLISWGSGRIRKLRVTIHGSPMCVTTYWNKSRGACPEKGDTVELKFRFKPQGTNRWELVRTIQVDSESTNPEESVMSSNTMSKDHVRFFVGKRYFRTTDEVTRLYTVLQKAFDISKTQSSDLILKNEEGFFVVCRPSQFARFMIYRDQEGIPNGFQDLRVELLKTDECDEYQDIANAAEVSRTVALRVLRAAGVIEKPESPQKNCINVANRPHQACYSS